jgi:hypothetical protein
MQKLKAHLDAKDFAEAEKTADAMLKMMGESVLEQLKPEGKSTESPTASTKTVRQRIAAKVERLMTAKVQRVKEGVQQWAASGRDPSAIGKALEEKFLPLMEAGKVLEAEVELDRLLEQLKSDGKGAASLNEPAQAMHQRKEGAHTSLAEKFKQLMEAGKFIEAEAELDHLLEQPNVNTESKPMPPAVPVPGIPDEEARAHVLHERAGPFFVSREKVQGDLKLSDDQKHKLWETMTGYVQETMKVQKLSGAERKEAMQSLRQKSYKQLEVFLKKILTPEQLKRFAELKLQYDMPMIMLRPDIVKELNTTDEQRQQFIRLIQEMQKVVVPLIQGSRSGGNPQGILAKVTKLRLDCQGKIEALLSDAQKMHWKEMTGTPLVIW